MGFFTYFSIANQPNFNNLSPLHNLGKNLSLNATFGHKNSEPLAFWGIVSFFFCSLVTLRMKLFPPSSASAWPSCFPPPWCRWGPWQLSPPCPPPWPPAQPDSVCWQLECRSYGCRRQSLAGNTQLLLDRRLDMVKWVIDLIWTTIGTAEMLSLGVLWQQTL